MTDPRLNSDSSIRECADQAEIFGVHMCALVCGMVTEMIGIRRTLNVLGVQLSLTNDQLRTAFRTGV